MALKDLTQDQRELAELLSEISERSYRAGWMQGIEEEVWRAMEALDLGSGRLKLTVEEVDRLSQLSTTCGGWIVFDDVKEETFVTFKECRRRQQAPH